MFICHKTLTADYLAEGLREALSEEKIKAFVANKDIPTKFKHTEKWSEFRNKHARKVTL